MGYGVGYPPASTLNADITLVQQCWPSDADSLSVRYAVDTGLQVMPA